MNNEITEVESVESEPMALVSMNQRVTAWSAALREKLTALAEQAKLITIAGHVDGEKAGAKAVRGMRLLLRSHRLPIQNEAKAMKDIGRSIVKNVGIAEDELIAIFAEQELRLQAEEDAYEVRQERIEKEKEEKKKRITALRFIQMQELGVSPLDYELCQVATFEAWEFWVIAWTEAQSASDALKKAENDRIEAETEAKRIDDAKNKAEEDAKKAEERAKEEKILAESKLIADAAREANKILEDEARSLREKMAKMEADEKERTRIAEEVTQSERDRIAKEKKDAEEKAENEAREDRLELARIMREKTEKEQAERDRPEIERLNNWRMEVRSRIEGIDCPTFDSAHVQDVFDAELSALRSAIPEIYPF